MRAAF